MAAVTGAIWKCATNNPENVNRLKELELLPILIQLLKDNCDQLDDLQFNPQKLSFLTNIVGAMAECARLPSNITLIKVSESL